MNKISASIVAAAIIIGGVSFYGGMKYAQSNAVAGLAQGDQRMAASSAGLRGGRGGSRSMGDFAAGEIIGKDDKSVTVKLRDGGSKIIFYSDVTEVDKFVNGNSADLEIGKMVIVNGKANPEGSMTAQSIQIRPVPKQPAQ